MNIFSNIEFLNPEYFFLLLLLPFLLYFLYKKQKKGHSFIFLEDLKKVFGKSSYLFYVKITLITLIFINFILILANPNTSNVVENIKKNGIDIVIALDISGSMEADDLKPSRIESAKQVINDFIGKLKTDRLGLVVFAGKPFTSIPLTFDYNILKETIGLITTNNINQQVEGLNGTAIGDAILMAKTLFTSSQPSPLEEKEQENKNSPSTRKERGQGGEVEKREKVIILLTDGDANAGVEPTLAGLSAKKEGIKIYTIGIGSKQGGYITYNNGPFTQQQKIPPLNEKTLRQIAQDTSGVFFRADNNDTFKQIFDELSKLQKSYIEVKTKKEYKPYYEPFLFSLVLLIGLFIGILFYRREI